MEAKLARLHWEVGDVHGRSLLADDFAWLKRVLPSAYKYLAVEGKQVAVLLDNGQLVDEHMLDLYRTIDKMNKKLNNAGMSRVWLFLDYNTEAV